MLNNDTMNPMGHDDMMDKGMDKGCCGGGEGCCKDGETMDKSMDNMQGGDMGMDKKMDGMDGMGDMDKKDGMDM